MSLSYCDWQPFPCGGGQCTFALQGELPGGVPIWSGLGDLMYGVHILSTTIFTYSIVYQ